MSSPARATRRLGASLAAAALAATAVAAVTSSTAASAAPAGSAGAAPSEPRAQLVQSTDAVPGQYVVFLDKAVPRGQVKKSADAASTQGAKVKDRFGNLRAYAAELDAAALDDVRRDPAVAFVAEDGVVTTQETQTGATWGLDRTDQRPRPVSGTFTYAASGAGVRAYVIDTGVNGSHREFTGRMAAGFTAVDDGRGTTDCNGHGTHVAGTVGGTTYGVAKRVTVVPVRVLGCDGGGTDSGVLAGINWVAGQAPGAVANMSLGGGASTSIDSGIARLTSAGITAVVAAGNENQNACNVSPARATSAITVGATTSTDARSSFSNYGTCVDLFAPGSSITSAWIGSTSATNTISGTSMASPHVAGVAAQYLQLNPGASPAAVTSAIVGNASTNYVTGANGSPNRLLFTSY